MPDEPFLRVELRNRRPVELLDLTMSLMALGQSYEDFVATQGADPIPGNVRLYVHELRGGSIIAVLQPILEQVSFVIEHRELLAGFLTNFNDLVSAFLWDRWRTEELKPTRREAERVAQVFEPVAKDNGSILILQIQGDVHVEQHAHQYKYDATQANVLQNKVRQFLGPALPREINPSYSPGAVLMGRRM